MRLRLVWLAAAVAAVAALAMGGGAVGPESAAAGPTTLQACNAGILVPQLGDVTVNQGVGSYVTQKLVRGKETLVRFFLKLPPDVGMTCSGSINVTSATLTVMNGTGTTDVLPTIGAYQSYGASGLAISSSSVSVNSQADPIFVVPASRLCDTATPCPTTSGFSRKFKATISYTRTTGGVTSTPPLGPITLTPSVTANFDVPTNDLRLLVIPMGDATQSYSLQFSAAAQAAVQSGMDTLSRLLPVRAGVSSDLASGTGGIRYTINLAAMLNLRAVPGAYNSSGRFCGSQANFDAIKGQLAQYLQAYNANPANAGHPADRVLGVVDAAKSDGSSANCAEGMASTSSTEAWVRAIPDQAASGRTAAAPSMTGSLMAMEILHTFGQELVSAGLIHSNQIQADGSSPDRGYHIASRSYIAKDLTVLNFVNTSTAPWNNNTTLLEFNAFERALCNLGGSLTSFCTLPADVGSPPAAALTDHFVLSATTDGTSGGTVITNSYFPTDSTKPILETPCLEPDDPPSPYDLVFHAPSRAETCRIPGSAITSEHDEGTHTNTTTALITGAFPVPGGLSRTDVTSVDLLKNGGVLATMSVPQDPPVITSLSNLAPGGGLTQTKTITTPEILPKPDVYFLADTTGSMGPALANVKTNASQILNTVKANSSQPRFGAGDYKDFRSCNEGEGPVCFAGDYAFNNAAPISADNGTGAATLAAIGSAEGTPESWSGWKPAGGGDDPEGQLYALHQLTAGNAAAWREDSSKILVWFGDNPGHDPVCKEISGAANDVTHGAVQSALQAADVRVIAVTLDTDGPESDFSTGLNGNPADDGIGDYTACGSSAPSSPNQADNFANATGGVVKTAESAAQVSDEILAGLTNLPATVTPTPGPTCDGEGDDLLTISFNPTSKEVTSGDDVTFTEQVDIADDANPGETLTCEITFLINGSVVMDGETPDPAFQQTISLTVAQPGAATTATVQTADDDPKAEIFVACDGLELPSHVAVPGTEVPNETNLWRFTANADTTNTCAESDGKSKVTIFVSDGANQVAGAVGETGTTIDDDREVPTASIYAPEADYVNPRTKPFALNGQVYDPDDGALTPFWKIEGPGNCGDVPGNPVGGVITGNFADVSPPSGTWANGDYKVTISGEDIDHNPAAASVCVHVRQYVFSGFLTPIRPLPVVNDGKIKSTIPIKWQLRDPLTNAFITDLAAVAEIKVAALPCPDATAPAACDVTPTGGTMLRYDTKSNQYVYNWLTPSKVGTYVLSVHFTDGTTYVAYFKLTK
jgi:hypothetical protein